MKETVLTFGAAQNLVGTLTLPQAAPGSPPDTAQPGLAFVTLNAGVIHRIGPHRFNVKLSRHLARLGFASLRLDLSGQGDSRPASGGESFDRQAITDLRAAMDEVERHTGIQRFVVAGICSGAFNGLAAAQEDPRIVGLWMMDGYTYVTPMTNWVRYGLQLRTQFWPTLGSWTKRALRLLGLGKLSAGMGASGSPTALLVDYGHTTPPRKTFATIMQTLVDRGVAIYLVYSGSMLWRYNHQAQFRDAFKGHAFVDHVRCDYLPEVDHTVTTLASQQLLLARIGQWASQLAATQSQAQIQARTARK